MVTSALCGLAWSAESLIAFRVLQGLAGGMIMPIGMITLAQAAGPQRMGRVMSVVGVPMLLGPGARPGPRRRARRRTCRGAGSSSSTCPIGIVGLVLAARLLPAGARRGPRRRAPGGWTGAGLLLLSPGVALVVFGLSEVATARLGDASRGCCRCSPARLLVAAFALRAWRTPAPIVDVRLFADRGFAAAAATVFLVGAALFGSLLLLPLYFQIARGLSPLRRRACSWRPRASARRSGMNRAGRLTDRVGGGPRRRSPGCSCSCSAPSPFTQVAADTPYWVLEVCARRCAASAWASR